MHCKKSCITSFISSVYRAIINLSLILHYSSQLVGTSFIDEFHDKGPCLSQIRNQPGSTRYIYSA